MAPAKTKQKLVILDVRVCPNAYQEARSDSDFLVTKPPCYLVWDWPENSFVFHQNSLGCRGRHAAQRLHFEFLEGIHGRHN